MKPTAVLVGACIPSLAHANVRLAWKFNDGPSSGLKDITFPINMAKAQHETGYILEQQFNFKGVRNEGYIGILPLPDRKGQSMLRANFTSYQGGTATCHPMCRAGTEFGAGVSCSIDVPYDYAHTYNLTVENVRDGLTWRGLLVDTVTRKSHEVGVWSLPSGAGDMRRSQAGYLQYLHPRFTGHSWGPDETCSRRPKIEATFYHPWSNSAGAGVLHDVRELGECRPGLFAKVKVTDGFTVHYGRRV